MEIGRRIFRVVRNRRALGPDARLDGVYESSPDGSGRNAYGTGSGWRPPWPPRTPRPMLPTVCLALRVAAGRLPEFSLALQNGWRAGRVLEGTRGLGSERANRRSALARLSLILREDR
jgi:hypothetical protein